MKALSVFSGGLDSILAAQLIRAQGIEVLGLFFETPFFTSTRALKSAAAIHLPISVMDITDAHLAMVKKPKHGYGRYMNPCIDCHALMLAEAGKLLEKEAAEFLITGEVLGQRPMSQNRRALSIVASESGFGGLILRPLSARLLPLTVPEERGWVNREGLLNLSGRSRKPQMELARRFDIRDYPAPAGGCLLTDVIFARRFKDLLASDPQPHIEDIEILKVGRHFRIGPHTKVVVGRNKTENDRITDLARADVFLLTTESVPGPTALLAGDLSPEGEELAASLVVSYSDARGEGTVPARLTGKGVDRIVQGSPKPKESFTPYRI